MNQATVRRLRIFFVVLIAAFLSECTSINIGRREGLRGLPGSTFMDLGSRNFEELNFYKEEWQFNKQDKNSPPKVCLAMSGGGIRSAAFNIGVLKGLHELGILENLDVMSGASGGAYALSWYYAQQHLTGFGAEALFEDPGPTEIYEAKAGDTLSLIAKEVTGDGANWQKLWQLNPEIPDPDDIRPGQPIRLKAGGVFQYALEKHTLRSLIELSQTLTIVSALSNFSFIPVNLVLNSAFGWHHNTTPGRRFYENRIGRIFHGKLPPGKLEPTAKPPVLPKLYFTFTGEPVEIAGLQETMQRMRLPFFIINATAPVDEGYRARSDRLSDIVFEITPLRYGSDAFGYTDEAPPFRMARAVAVSGAAIDSSIIPGSSQRVWLSALNFDLGYYIENKAAGHGWGTRFFHKILPFPLYYSHHYLRDQDALKILLSDAGHSENLGAFSLIRRLCNQIIIVDAEDDRDYEFASYHLLKDALRHDLGADMSIEDLENGDFDKSEPILTGKVSCFPYTREGDWMVEGECVDLDLIFIKLSIDEDENKQLRRSDYDDSIKKYYEKHRDDTLIMPWLGPPDPFPQQSTVDQKFEPDQYRAYRDLGHFIATHYGLGWDGARKKVAIRRIRK